VTKCVAYVALRATAKYDIQGQKIGSTRKLAATCIAFSAVPSFAVATATGAAPVILSSVATEGLFDPQ